MDPARPRLAAAGRAAEAFESWEADSEVAQRLLNPAIPLTFHSLQIALKKAFTGLGVHKDSILAASVIAASLLEPTFRTP